MAKLIIPSLLALVVATVPATAPLAREAKQYRRVLGAPSGSNEQILSVPLAGSGQQRFLFSVPAQVQATIIMLPGGTGDVGLTSSGDIRHGDNFVVRTRRLWTEKGYAILIPDTVEHANLRGARSSAAYGGVILRLIAFAHARNRGPVYLLGTSQGSIAAVNTAARSRPGDVAGLVLTESVTVMGASHETVFDADPASVRVPVLIVVNRADTCRVAPPVDAEKIARGLARSPSVKVEYVDGGEQRSASPCGSLTPHGYYGIEPSVVSLISRWIASHR